MEKGILIMTSVFVAIGIIHFFSLKIIRASLEKKKRLRSMYTYFYGIVYTITGIVQLNHYDSGLMFSIVQIIFGVMLILLNYFGKLYGEE